MVENQSRDCKCQWISIFQMEVLGSHRGIDGEIDSFGVFGALFSSGIVVACKIVHDSSQAVSATIF